MATLGSTYITRAGLSSVACHVIELLVLRVRDMGRGDDAKIEKTDMMIRWMCGVSREKGRTITDGKDEWVCMCRGNGGHNGVYARGSKRSQTPGVNV